MNEISILDCTLRDGGYINHWNFGEKQIQRIIRGLEKANIDIIECGFLREELYNRDSSVFSDVIQISPFISQKQAEKMYVAMIEYGKMDPDKIPLRSNKTIDGIRVTFHKGDWDKASLLINSLIKKGYNVFVQPVGTTSYTDEELFTLIEEVNQINPFAFYLVDTLGVMYKKDLLRQFYLVDHNLSSRIRIGFHSHNNLQMSFSDAQELIRSRGGRKIIIDSSVYGMGRGAGNLATELITHYINENLTPRYHIAPLLNIVDQQLMKIYNEQRWGYDLPFFLSATENCHPNYAAYLMNKQTLDINNIAKLLSLIPEKEKELFNKKLIEDMYVQFQQFTIDDTDSCSYLKKHFSDKPVLVLGSGNTLTTEKKAIMEHIEKTKPIIISINFIPDNYPINWFYISNQKRISMLDDEKKDISIIATSNLKEKLAGNIYWLNYSDYLGEGSELDNSGAMLIRLLRKIGVRTIYIAGLDGFDENGGVNYCVDDYKRVVDYSVASQKNNDIAIQLKDALDGSEYYFITPTRYKIT